MEFLAVDMHSANRFVVHIFTAVAEQEAEAISKRTKAAPAAGKERGTVLGGRRVSAERFAEIAEEARQTFRARAAGEVLRCCLSSWTVRGRESARYVRSLRNGTPVRSMRLAVGSGARFRCSGCLVGANERQASESEAGSAASSDCGPLNYGNGQMDHCLGRICVHPCACRCDSWAT